MGIAEPATSFVDAYGPYAFGTVAIVLLVLVLAVVWAKVFRPEMHDRVKLAEAHVKVAASLQQTSVNVLETGKVMSGSLERLERITDRILERLADT